MSDALHTMHRLIEAERNSARSALHEAENWSNQALAQLEQLRQYRADTLARAPGQRGQLAGVVQLQWHGGFVGRLDQAITQQTAVLAQASAQLQRRRELLLQAEVKLASVAKMMERRAAEEGRVLARREQRAADEAAALLHRVRAASHSRY
jgi:flagellar protein FliJ